MSRIKKQLAREKAYEIMLREKFRQSICYTCMGCVQMEKEGFVGKYECGNYKKYER